MQRIANSPSNVWMEITRRADIGAELVAPEEVRPLVWVKDGPGMGKLIADWMTDGRTEIDHIPVKEELTLRHGRVRDAQGIDRGTQFLAALDEAWRAQHVDAARDALPFHTGWAVFLGYELAGEIEPRLRLPSLAGAAKS